MQDGVQAECNHHQTQNDQAAHQHPHVGDRFRWPQVAKCGGVHLDVEVLSEQEAAQHDEADEQENGKW